jgi:hypothetical protein
LRIKRPEKRQDVGSYDSYPNNLDTVLHVNDPEGLNYDENGELVAVFYYHGIDVKQWVFAPSTTLVQQSIQLTAANMLSNGHINPGPGSTGHPRHLFDSHDAMWHWHWGPCWDDLNYAVMAFDTSHTPYFTQPLTPAECQARAPSTSARQGWVPGFNMLHVWLYKLNPCGTFAGTHPHVWEDAMEEPMVTTHAEWFQKMGLSF